MKKKNLLFEVAGVPKAIDTWVGIFNYALITMIKKASEAEEIEETDFKWEHPETGEIIEGKMYRHKSKMSGDELMELILKSFGMESVKDLISKDFYKNFPLYKPTIKLNIIYLPDKVIEYESRGGSRELVEAQHESAEGKLSKLGGENLAFIKQNFGFKIFAPISWLEGEIDILNYKNYFKPTISHELTHSYESYMRIKGSGGTELTGFFGRESLLNAAKSVMADQKYPQWNYFLHLVYLHLSYEINARITQLYYELKGKDIKASEDFIKAVKKSSVWDELKKLEGFDATQFVNSFEGSKLGFIEMLEDIGYQVEGRVKKGLPPIKPRHNPNEAMKHLIDVWNAILQNLNTEIKDMGYTGKFMEEVPQKAKEDPMFFFKFFEKRFHKKAEKFKRKILRLSYLILNEKNT